jgi:hypothetical protein
MSPSRGLRAPLRALFRKTDMFTVGFEQTYFPCTAPRLAPVKGRQLSDGRAPVLRGGGACRQQHCCQRASFGGGHAHYISLRSDGLSRAVTRAALTTSVEAAVVRVPPNTVVVVESPAKAKKIQRYLGPDYHVSWGPIRSALPVHLAVCLALPSLHPLGNHLSCALTLLSRCANLSGMWGAARALPRSHAALNP